MEKFKEFLSKKRWISIAFATIFIGFILSFLSPAFLKVTNMQSILVQSSITGIMAIGMTFIILSGGIDISIGAILFFTSSLFAKLMQTNNSIPLVFAIAILFALVLGAINGVLIVKFKIAPLITTLATYTIYRGMAIHLTSAQNIPVPREVGFLGNGRVMGVPVPIILLLIIFIIGTYLFTKTKLGVYAMAIGNSENSAKESNIPVYFVTIVVYIIGGFTAGIGSLILIARVGGLQSGMGIGIEFTVIAAVVLGGTKLSGGSGTIIGSVIGAVFLVLIDNGLNLINASPYIYDVVKGGVLLAAVMIEKISIGRQSKLLLEQKANRIRCSVE
ncbi:ABC transporter permease [Clostridium grantii]|uniref:Ribose transport system permease protein n=1 Tax=Clostridium grantii DSM 8605 TaxID=1121316 RepID=A0A1M5V6H4_9CLOT|nr:ABC transporter permease [Clostridium grantii]SHH70738.1 ribose transport system permease protein [Clostridium grantii DSM 8605]